MKTDKTSKQAGKIFTILDLPTRGLFSISTAFVTIFLFFVAILGASLMGVSVTYSAASNELLTEGGNQAQYIYMSLVKESNKRLVNASNSSILELTKIISLQINERVISDVIAYTGMCQFSVSQMANMMSSGEMEEADMDYTIRKM